MTSSTNPWPTLNAIERARKIDEARVRKAERGVVAKSPKPARNHPLTTQPE